MYYLVLTKVRMKFAESLPIFGVANVANGEASAEHGTVTRLARRSAVGPKGNFGESIEQSHSPIGNAAHDVLESPPLSM